MPLYEINSMRPVIGEGTWIAPSAEVIGDVKIGRNCFIGFGAIIRGDFGAILIGDESVVEENVVIHVGSRAEIGDRVIIGHMAMIHDVIIKDCVLIGMQSMLCDNSIIGEWTIIAEKTLVKKNLVVPSYKIYGGSPAKEIGNLEERHREYLVSGQQAYVDLTKRYFNTFKKI